MAKKSSTTDILTFNPDKIEETFLSYYLSLDTWSVREALCLFLRLNPNTTDLVWPIAIGNPMESVTITSYVPAGRTSWVHRIRLQENDLPDSDASDEQHDMYTDQCKLEDLRRAWFSQINRKEERYAPIEFIEWAKRRGFAIPWLEWAKQTERILNSEDAKERSDISQTDDLSGRKGSVALNIIGALLIKGYSMNIHSERLTNFNEVHKDLNDSGLLISEKTLRIWIRDAAKATNKMKVEQAAKPS